MSVGSASLRIAMLGTRGAPASYSGFETCVVRCAIVGDAPYAGAYIRELRATTDPRIVFTGYLFGEGYRELAGNAYCFVETSEVSWESGTDAYERLFRELMREAR